LMGVRDKDVLICWIAGFWIKDYSRAIVFDDYSVCPFDCCWQELDQLTVSFSVLFCKL